MGALAARIKGWWITADRTQKLVTLFGSAFLIVLVSLAVFFTSKPAMRPVYVGLTPEDQGKVVDALNREGIPVEIGNRGDVLVPAEMVASAKMKLATAGALPRSGQQGFELIEGMNAMTTPAQEKARLVAAREGELAQSIQSMEGISSATVRLNIGQSSRVLDRNADSSAAVILGTTSDAMVSPEMGRAIALLLQNSVPNLKRENITVTDTLGRLLFDGTEESGGTSASRKREAEREESLIRQRDLQAILDRAFGPGNTQAHINVELDMDEVTEQSNQTKVDEGVVQEKVTEKLDGANPNAGGPAGIDANIAGATNNAGSSDNGYEMQSTYAVVPQTQINKTIKRAQGSVKSQTVTVLVDAEKVEDVKAVQQAVAGFTGLAYDATTGITNTEETKATVTATKFDTSTAEEQKKAAASAKSSATMQQVVSFLPIAALLAVGFMLTKAIGKAAPKPVTNYIPAEGLLALDESTARMVKNDHRAALRVVEGGGASALMAGGPNQKVLELARAHQAELLSADDKAMLKSTATAEQAALIDRAQTMSEVMQALGLDPDGDNVDVEGIKKRLDLPLEQIKKLARQRPETVAMLLKSWISEDR